MKKGDLAAAFFRKFQAVGRSGGLVFRREDRAGILALGLDVAVDELDDRERGVVAKRKPAFMMRR